jgi:hypothetical protein
MRARNVLTRLAAVAPQAEPPIDSGEEDRILERILASPRDTARRRPLALVLAGVAILAAAAVAASLELGNSSPSAPRTSANHRVALTGPRIALAGYHFRTPAGFKKSSSACAAASSGAGPDALSKSGSPPLSNGFAAAASADGGCVGASFLIASNPTAVTATPAGKRVDVGSYQGYYDTQGNSGESTLYIALPKADPAAGPVYLVLFADGLTEDQLIAVAQSGLPGSQ